MDQADWTKDQFDEQWIDWRERTNSRTKDNNNSEQLLEKCKVWWGISKANHQW